MTLAITCHFAAILALMLIALSVRVILLRYKHRVALGDGGEKNLQSSIRAHGNFVEYTPIFLILMALVEAQGNDAPEWFLITVGSLFVLARLSHAHSLINVEPKSGSIRFRQFGMVTSFSCIATFALFLLV